jgi:3-phenylpropionate/trans-cinnamate dioxygenase ferredoxin subunit
MADFVPVVSADAIAEGTVQAFDVGGVEIAVAQCDGQFYAFTNICSHEHAYLSEGDVDTDECVIECPLHGARFDMATGRVRALPATEPITTYPTRVVDGQVEVAIDE